MEMCKRHPSLQEMQERICDRLYGHIRHMVHQNQHGFLHGRSCTTQLLSTLHDIGQLLNNILFVDFAKAFDSVDRTILLQKLQGYGVSGNLYSWFSDFLSGRAQRVVV